MSSKAMLMPVLAVKSLNRPALSKADTYGCGVRSMRSVLPLACIQSKLLPPLMDEPADDAADVLLLLLEPAAVPESDPHAASSGPDASAAPPIPMARSMFRRESWV